MVIKSYAKINVALRVLNRLENGYHDVEMVNLPLELHDVVEVEPMTCRETFITFDDPRLMNLEGNLCKKALDALSAKYPLHHSYRIFVHKEIPFAAGLGGGSSNAAAVLVALNKTENLGLSNEELSEIGLPVGADVPYFLINKPARVTGIGEKINPIKVKKQYWCLIVKPVEGLSTRDVYEKCDSFPRIRMDIDKVVEGLASGDDEMISKNIGNDLMSSAVSLLPSVGEIFASLQNFGFLMAGMSGSGSSLYGLTNDPKKAKEACRKFLKAGYISLVTRTMI